MNTSFFGEMLNSITERGRALLDRTRDRRDVQAARSESFVDLCEELTTRDEVIFKDLWRAAAILSRAGTSAAMGLPCAT